MEVARPTLVLDTQVFRDLFNTSPIGIAVENFNGQPLFVLTRIPAYMIFFPASCLNEVAISLRSVPSGSEFEVGDFVTTIAVPFPAYRLSLLEQYRLSRGERYGV